jgi:hypothetical protein
MVAWIDGYITNLISPHLTYHKKLNLSNCSLEIMLKERFRLRMLDSYTNPSETKQIE